MLSLVAGITGALAASGLGALTLGMWAATNPDKAAQLLGKALRGVSWLGRSVRRRAIGLSTQGTANELLDTEIFSLVARDHALPRPAIQLHMVKEPEEARMLSDGKIIVRMRDEGDHARNVLRVIRVAAPMFCAPEARPYLQDEFREAIYLQLVRKVARKLGPQAERIFATDLSSPGRARAEARA